MSNFCSGYSCFQNDNCGDDTNPWKDPAMWWFAVGILIAAVLASVVSVPSKLAAYDTAVGHELHKDFWIPVPEWTVPLLWLGIYVSYFFATYLTYRKMKNPCAGDNVDDCERSRDRGFLVLVYVIILVLIVLWSFTYLGAHQPHFALLIGVAMIATVIWQMILTAKYGINGAWYLILPLLVYLALFALPITGSSIVMSGNHKFSGWNKSMGTKGDFKFLGKLAP